MDLLKLPRLNDPDAWRAILWERARLAMVDPGGEADAVRPMTRDEAAKVLADHAPELWSSPPGRHPAQPDSTGIAAALGIDTANYRGRVPCPAHGNHRSRTLSWALTPDGRLLVYCFAGCTYDDIRKAALG